MNTEFTRHQPSGTDGWRCTACYFVRIDGRSVGWVMKHLNSTSGSWSAKRGGIVIGHGYATRRAAAEALRIAAGIAA